jgi:uncharacterized protein (TIGR02145 family)
MGGADNVVNIGGIDYNYIQVGNLYIITENLRNHTSSNWYYPNNDPNNEMEMGLLYACKLVYDEIIPILPSGWRVPTQQDFIYLRENVYAGSEGYISTIDGGDDGLKTNIRLTGYRNKNGQFVSFGSTAPFWTTSEAAIDTSFTPVFQLQHVIQISIISQGSHTYLSPTAISVRVVKDV